MTTHNLGFFYLYKKLGEKVKLSRTVQFSIGLYEFEY